MVLTVGLARGQNSKIRYADELFARSEYLKAIDWYEAGLKKNPQGEDRNTKAMQRLVRACLATRKYDKAEYWLGQLNTELGLDPAWYFHYGQVLLTNGKPEEARKWFYAYGAEGGKSSLANGFMELIDELQKRDPLRENISVETLPFNAKYTDFGPQWYQEGLIFTSGRREVRKGVMRRSAETGTPLLDIYYVKEDESWSKPKPLIRSGKHKQHKGPGTFDPEGEVLYLNQSQRQVRWGKKSKGPELGIYTTQAKGKKWTKPQAIPFPDTDADYLHPSVSADGKWLYFAANLPGGAGGFDLYRCAVQSEGYGQPEWLGPSINTPFDELYPFAHGSDRLYFASYGHPGYGGLDLFESRMSGESWSTPVNMGMPLNSRWDDFSLVLDPGRKSGFFASNRTDQNFNDDLFQCWVELEEFEDCPEATLVPLCYKYSEEGTEDELPYQLIYSWSFGDGTSALGAKARHCYETYGDYIVELSVIDSTTGEPIFSQARYQLSIPPPTGPAIQITDETLAAGELHFSAASTTLPGYSLEGYYWDWGSGFQAGGPEEVATFTGPGEHTVKLGIVAFDPLQLEEKRFCVSKTFTLDSEVVEEVVSVPGKDPSIIQFSLVPLKQPEFRIQLGTSAQRVSLEHPVFKGLVNVYEVEDNGVFRYFVGGFSDKDSALVAVQQFRKLGFPKAVAMTFVNSEIQNSQNFRKNWLPEVEPELQPKPDWTVLKWQNIVSRETVLQEQIRLKRLDSLLSSVNKARYQPFADPDRYYPTDYNLNLFNRTNPLDKGKDFRLISFRELAERKATILFKDIYYARGAYQVPAEAYQELFRITRFLMENPEMQVEVIGHTDGVEPSGDRMAKRRASGAAQFLVLSGCNAANIRVTSGNSQFPLIFSPSPKDQSLNRRVEFRIIPRN